MQKKSALIKVAVCTIEQLLAGGKIYAQDNTLIHGKLTIPVYQRPYVWEEKHIAKLIDDIKEHRQQFGSSSYYLGSVILHAHDQQLDIIDGQQRLTTLAILGYLSEQLNDLPLRYHSSVSVGHIKHNLEKLRIEQGGWMEHIDFSQLVVSVVVTQSEDDAYKFFETQNTGGVRLTGVDIIKAHHLRAVEQTYRNYYAKTWENLGDLHPVVMALLRGRYWNSLAPQTVPFYQEKRKIRDAVVTEFAEKALKGEADVAFAQIRTIYSPIVRYAQQNLQNCYQLRQPLNAGINSISYLAYFQDLYSNYYKDLTVSHLTEYIIFIQWLKKIRGCRFLEELFITGLILYVSQFGEYKLDVFAKKLFRVAYSKRVSNQKAVRADSIREFLSNFKILDWISFSFTPEQVFHYFDGFELKVDSNGLHEGENSIKKEFVEQTNQYFNLGIQHSLLAQQFAEKLTQVVNRLG